MNEFLGGVWSVLRLPFVFAGWCIDRITSREVICRCRALADLFLGSWRRAAATSIVAAGVGITYWPQETWPVVTGLLSIALQCFAIYVMFSWLWPKGSAKKKKGKSS